VIVDGRVPCPGAEVYEGQIRELALFISGTDPDVVLLNTLGEWVAGDAAQRVGLPTIWSIHESFELDHWLDLTRGREAWDPYLKDRLITTLGAADRLVFEAEATSQMFARYADADHRSVVKYGVDVDAIAAYERDFDRAASRAKHGIRDEAVVLLSMGVVGERKATACLIDGFQKAAADHPNASLIIVGDHPSPYSYLLHRLMDASGLGDRLRLLPITPHIWEWYALSDILVSASDIESLPRSMLEAMAFGLPTLSTDVFGIPELIDDGHNGWLFPARDIAEEVAALQRILALSRAERQAVGEAGRETVRQGYRSAGYGEVYFQMISGLARNLS
jgi:glycosyltransferase involved in cell wall biosynthesis